MNDKYLSHWFFSNEVELYRLPMRHHIKVPFLLIDIILGIVTPGELHTPTSLSVYPDMPRGDNEASARLTYLRFLDVHVGGFRYTFA